MQVQKRKAGVRLSVVDQMGKKMLAVELSHNDEELVPVARFHKISMIRLAMDSCL